MPRTKRASEARLAAFYQTLGRHRMMTVFLYLHRHGATHMAALAEKSGMLNQNASTSLRLAHANGFLVRQRVGKRTMYSIAPEWRDAIAEVAARVGAA